MNKPHFGCFVFQETSENDQFICKFYHKHVAKCPSYIIYEALFI